MEKKLHTFLFLVIYYIALHFAYTHFMLEAWGQDFLETSWGYGEKNEFAFEISAFLFAIGAFITSRVGNRPSDYMHLFFFITPIMPMCVIASYKQVGVDYLAWAMVCFSISLYVSKLKMTSLSIRLQYGIISQTNYIYLSIFIGLLVLLLTIARGGLNFLNFDFSSVYEFRRDASSSRGAILNYLLLNYIGVILSFGFALAIYLKKYLFIALLIFINTLIFGLTSNKSFLFVGVFTLGLYYILGLRSPKKALILLFCVISAGLTLLFVYDPDLLELPTLFVRRYLFVPAYANFLYWEFFTTNPYAYWSDSTVGLGIVQSPYGVSTPRVIGSYFTGIDVSSRAIQFHNANTGWLGSGYGNAGVVGMLIYAVLSGVVTNYVNYLSYVTSPRVATAGVGFYFFSVFFTSTDLPAALLSYGFFSLVFIIMIWRQPGEPISLRSQRRPQRQRNAIS